MQLCFGKLNWQQSSDPRVAWWRQCFSEWSLCKERANFLSTSPQKIKKKNRSTCCCLVCVTESASNHRVHVSNACENVQFPLCSFWIGQFSLSLLPTLCLTLHPTDKSSTKQRHVKATRLFSLPSSFQRNLHGGERQSPLGLHGSAEGGHYLQYWLTSGAQCWCFMIGEHTRVAFGGTKLVFVTEVKKKKIAAKQKKRKRNV